MIMRKLDAGDQDTQNACIQRNFMGSGTFASVYNLSKPWEWIFNHQEELDTPSHLTPVAQRSCLISQVFGSSNFNLLLLLTLTDYSSRWTKEALVCSVDIPLHLSRDVLHSFLLASNLTLDFLFFLPSLISRDQQIRLHSWHTWSLFYPPFVCFRPFLGLYIGYFWVNYELYNYNLDSILKSREITLSTKVRLVKTMVFPAVMYECESWTVKKAEHWRIDAFELWCWRKPLRVPWTARRSNQSILKEISPECS